MKQTKIYKDVDIPSLKAGQTYEQCVFDMLSIKGKELQDSTFTNCSFEKCNLTGTKFNNTTFTSCNFSNADVSGCNFFSATFTECKLLGVVLSRANSWVGVTFTACNFDYADMRGMDLSGMDLSKCSFFETDFSLANLEKTVFINSRVANIKLGHTKMNMTDFRGAELLGFNLHSEALKDIILTPQQVIQLAQEVGIHVMEGDGG